MRRVIASFIVAALVLSLTSMSMAVSFGTTERVSVSSTGEQANVGSDFPSISADGRYVAFNSAASNLVPGDTNTFDDVFVKDLVTGIIEIVSVSSTGEPVGGGCPSIGADGRYVAYQSGANNLVPGDTNDFGDIFVYDRQTGITERVSVSSTGEEAKKATGTYIQLTAYPSISADGRYIAFFSSASNLVPDDTNEAVDVFVHDRLTGITERASISSASEQGNSASFTDVGAAISADGRYVIFESYASNLVPNDTNGDIDVFIHDRQTRTTERVSVSSSGEQADSGSIYPAISADGRCIAFASGASNLVPNSKVGGLYIRDRATGITELVSVSNTGAPGSGFNPSVSADGRFVAFKSVDENLVPDDTNGWGDIFVRDRQLGTTERVSVSSSGEQANRASWKVSINADGRYVAFSSRASNLVEGDTNEAWDIFVRDRGIFQVKVNIDIKPGSFPNSINLKSKGNIPVAILSDATFDATTVDPSTVVFASAFPLPIGGSPEDVNGDGKLDIVLHFDTQALNLKPGDTAAMLTGRTLSGQEFTGGNSVRIVK